MRNERAKHTVRPLVEAILTSSFVGESIDDRLAELKALRAAADGAEPEIDRALLEAFARQHAGLLEAREHQRQARNMLERLAAPPLFPALFLGATTIGKRQVAIVCHAGARRIVSFGTEIDPATLAVGDDVVLGHDLNVVLSRAPTPLSWSGETALFERLLSDGRAVVRFRDEERIVRLADAVRDTPLRSGDPVRWDSAAGLALERVERSRGEHLFLEETPRETFADIGGLDREIRRIQDHVRLHTLHAEIARQYGLVRPGAILLVGPPGTGKTMIARAFANWLGTLSATGRARFMHVKPGGLNSMWFGQSEANIREAFRVAREAGEADPSVPLTMFWDELDAIGAARGDTLHRVDERVLQAFMVELNGLESRGNVLVVAATNRLDALDPALLREGRLGDLLVPVPRPDRRGARAILAKHFPEGVPCADAGGAARERLLDAAVARIYASGGEGLIATLTLRDGRRHEVRGAAVMSGARLARIARAARERSALRRIAGGPPGVTLADLEEAIGNELADAARVLTPVNCRRHLEGLPQDVDVVRIDPVPAKVASTHRYLDLAPVAG